LVKKRPQRSSMYRETAVRSMRIEASWVASDSVKIDRYVAASP